jgi:hypothetical protein
LDGYLLPQATTNCKFSTPIPFAIHGYGAEWQVGRQLYIFPSYCSAYPATRRKMPCVTTTVLSPTLSKLSHGKKKNIKGSSFLALGSTVLYSFFLSLGSIYSGTTTVGISDIDIKYERVSCYACFSCAPSQPIVLHSCI